MVNMSARERRIAAAEYREYIGSVYEIVQDPDDWRAPIDCVLKGVQPQDIGIINSIREAVFFFTGSQSHFHSDPDGVRIISVGYRNGPCGP